MKVISIKADKGYTSPSNNITYHNYYVQVGIPRDMGDGTSAYVIQNYTLSDKAIRSLIDSRKINSINDLIGREVQIFRQFPVYFDKVERDYMLPKGQIKADLVVITK